MRRHAFDRFGTPPAERRGQATPVSDFCRRTGSVSFFDSVVVFERADRQEPWHEVR